MINLSASGGSVTFEFIGNSGYLQDGTITVPVNSLSMIIDESDMVTFRKPNNDVFISALLSEFGKTKEEMIAWYKANMVGSTGGGGITSGEVQTMIDASISGKADYSAATFVNEDETETTDYAETGMLSKSFDYDDGVYYFSGRTLDNRDYFLTLTVTLNDSATGTPISVTLNTATGETDAYIFYKKSDSQELAVTAKGNYRIVGVSFQTDVHHDVVYTYKAKVAEEVAASTAIKDVIYPELESLEAAISGKADTSAVTNAISAATDDMATQTWVNNQGFLTEHQSLSAYSTTEEVNNAIEEATSGKADSSAVTEEITAAVSGKVETSAITSAVTSASTNSEIPTAKAVFDAIGEGGGGGSCTVDSNTIYDYYDGNYDKSEARQFVCDYYNRESDIVNVCFIVFDTSSYQQYINGCVTLDYTEHTCSFPDQSYEDYLDVAYDSSIGDFTFGIKSDYPNAVFQVIYGMPSGMYIKIPAYTITSGDPCTVIETGVNGAINSVSQKFINNVNRLTFNSNNNSISVGWILNGGNGNSAEIKLEEIDGSDNVLKPNIQVGTGVSGWTEINFDGSQCAIYGLKMNKFRVTYDYESFDSQNMYIYYDVKYDNGQGYIFTNQEHVEFDSVTQLPSLSTQILGATISWDASTKVLIVDYPFSFTDGSYETYNITVIGFASNTCQLGSTVSKLESYGENQEPIKQYVQETKAQLGGLTLMKISQSDYDDLVSSGATDSNTLYIINN